VLYYYEIVVRMHGQDRVLRRVPTRRAADRVVAELVRADVVSRNVVRWERRRGLHPWTAALLSGMLTLFTPLAPAGWLRMALFLVLLALTAGFLTSGWRWIAGGADDR
jgi:hypothetical protein